MDDVSGLADRSKEFANFLTVSHYLPDKTELADDTVADKTI